MEPVGVWIHEMIALVNHKKIKLEQIEYHFCRITYTLRNKVKNFLLQTLQISLVMHTASLPTTCDRIRKKSEEKLSSFRNIT